jgi:hypothetical protein
MIDFSVPQIQLIIMSVQDAIATAKRDIAQAEAADKDISDLDEHLVLLRGLEAQLRDGCTRLRSKDKSLLSYEALTGGMRFRKL